MFQTPNYTFTRQFSPKTTVGLLHTSPPCSGLAACVKYFNISSSAANYRGNLILSSEAAGDGAEESAAPSLPACLFKRRDVRRGGLQGSILIA